MTARRKGNAPGADPVVTEIVRRGVMAVTQDMKTNLMRTAYNLIIYEALDFTVGLFTAQGETISIGLGLPMFIRGMAETVKAKIAKFGDDMAPRDIFSEGLQIPILKYCAAGKVNRDLVELIRMNVRIPSRAMGDLRAQLTALRAGERGFVALVRRYGRDAVLGAIRIIMDQCEE